MPVFIGDWIQVLGAPAYNSFEQPCVQMDLKSSTYNKYTGCLCSLYG